LAVRILADYSTLRTTDDMTDTQTPVASHRFAKAPHLWALGVGAVISGDFFGWQSALIAGFDGLLVTLSIVTVLYVLLSFSIAELSTTLPAGGGPYVFALHGIGRPAAFFAGLAESLKVIITCAVVVTGIGSYLNSLLDLDSDYGPLWWCVFYVLFVVLNVVGIELSFRIQLFTTVLSVILLLVFYVAAIPKVSYDQWVSQVDWKFPGGLDGIIKGLSFTLWFYLGIEELPLAVEDTIEPEKNMPRGLMSSIATLVALSFCTVIFNSMISPGAAALSLSGSPLLDGYKTVFGDNSTTSGFTWLLIVGLICSFHSFIYCMGRLLYAIARDGYFPHVLTKLHPTRGTAYVSLITGSAIGLFVAILLHFIIGDTRLGSVLINLALIGALVSYSFQLTAFIRLRIYEPERHRPYKSPFGVPGAVVCLFLCALALFSIIYSGAQSNDFLASVIGAIVFFALGGVYYFHSVKPYLGAAKAIRDPLLSSSDVAHKI
jgi:amino acid transporter